MNEVSREKLRITNRQKAVEALAVIILAFTWLGLGGYLLNRFSAIPVELKQMFIMKNIAIICITAFLIVAGIGSLMGFSIKGSLRERIKWSYLMLSALICFFGSRSGTGGLLFTLFLVSGVAGKFLRAGVKSSNKSQG